MFMKAGSLMIVTFFLLASFSIPAFAARVETVVEHGSDTAILFMHGLEGNFTTSFQNETSNISWPGLIQADARVVLREKTLSSFDIYAVDYSDVFVGTDIVNVSVEEITQQVATALTSHDLLRTHKYVWIIAHSLGGIITKRILIKWSTAGYQRYIDRIIGVSLLGVPSNGAPLADIGSTFSGRAIGAWLGINAKHIRDLNTIDSMNTFLRAVENDWANFLDRRIGSIPLIACAYETVSEYWIFGFYRVTIVPEIYTKTRCDGEAMPINKAHTALPKPSGAFDPIEDWLYDSVRKAFLYLDSNGEKFTNADRVGAFWRIISHIQTGNRYIDDATGLPYIDETVTVSEPSISKLKFLKLAGSHYRGANWADVLKAVAEENSCISVDIRDKSRRDIVISLINLVACKASSGAVTSYVCKAENCR